MESVPGEGGEGHGGCGICEEVYGEAAGGGRDEDLWDGGVEREFVGVG